MPRIKKLFVTALAAVFLATVATATVTQTANASATASVQGKLLNGYDGTPMPGATARLFRWSGSGWTDTERTTTANSWGQYYFGSLLEGYYYTVVGKGSVGTTCTYGIYAYAGVTHYFRASGTRTGHHAYLKMQSRIC